MNTFEAYQDELKRIQSIYSQKLEELPTFVEEEANRMDPAYWDRKEIEGFLSKIHWLLQEEPYDPSVTLKPEKIGFDSMYKGYSDTILPMLSKQPEGFYTDHQARWFALLMDKVLTVANPVLSETVYKHKGAESPLKYRVDDPDINQQTQFFQNLINFIIEQLPEMKPQFDQIDMVYTPEKSIVHPRAALGYVERIEQFKTHLIESNRNYNRFAGDHNPEPADDDEAAKREYQETLLNIERANLFCNEVVAELTVALNNL